MVRLALDRWRRSKARRIALVTFLGGGCGGLMALCAFVTEGMTRLTAALGAVFLVAMSAIYSVTIARSRDLPRSGPIDVTIPRIVAWLGILVLCLFPALGISVVLAAMEGEMGWGYASVIAVVGACAVPELLMVVLGRRHLYRLTLGDELVFQGYQSRHVVPWSSILEARPHGRGLENLEVLTDAGEFVIPAALLRLDSEQLRDQIDRRRRTTLSGS